MDTTKKYIKICEKAGEIQKHIPGKWDIYYIDFTKSGWKNVYEIVMTYWDTDLNGDEVWLVPHFELDREWDKRDKGMTKTWLPRQDQLQEMVYANEHSFALLERLWNWWQSSIIKCGYCVSLEQLWLAFAMHEKYGKVWDKEKREWIKPPVTT